jgi:4'-phosphopantetheinyl transferase
VTSPVPLPLWPSPGCVHVVVVRISLQLPRLGPLTALLSAAEREQARRFHFDRDRHRHLVSHGAMRLCLAAALGCAPEVPDFLAGPHGKPHLAAPLGDGELRFNLSHSGDLALCALTTGAEVGVDVEQLRPDLDWEPLARHIFTSPEVASILAFSPAQQRRAFFRLWTCKEALVKARGDGLSLPLELFEVQLDGQQAHLDTGRLPDGPGAYALTELDLADPSHVATVVTSSASHRVLLWSLEADGTLARRA